MLILILSIFLWTCQHGQLFPVETANDDSFYERRQSRLRSPPGVIATFRYERNRTGRKPGWNVSGCYCPASNFYCDCSRASNRVNMFIAAKSKPLRGRAQSKRLVKYRERVKGRQGVKTKPLSIRTGCFCDAKGCRGQACNDLNGCVCNDDTGRCWGNNCPASRSVNDSTDPQEAMRLSQALGFSDSLLGPVELENTRTANSFLDENFFDYERMSASGCYCNEEGCHGSHCLEMNGCFCGTERCWGRHCGQSEHSLDTVFNRKKFPGLEYDSMLDGKVGMMKTKFENLLNSKKNMMSAMGNKFGDLVHGKVNAMGSMGNKFGDLINNKVNMVSGKLNGIVGSKVNMMSSMGNKFEDLMNNKVNMMNSMSHGFDDLISGGEYNLPVNNQIPMIMEEGLVSNLSPNQDLGSLVNAQVNTISNGASGSGKTKLFSDNNQLGNLVNGKVSLVENKLNMITEGKGKLINSLTGKLSNIMTAKPLSNMVSGVDNGLLSIKPITNVGGKLDALLGKKVNTINGDVKSMKNLVGHVIPVIQGYPIESTVGIPMSKLHGVTIESHPSTPLENVPGQHTHRIKGQVINNAGESQLVKSTNGVAMNQLTNFSLGKHSPQPTAIVRSSNQGTIPMVTVRTIQLPQKSSNHGVSREGENDSVTSDEDWT